MACHLQAGRDHSLSVEENSKQRIVALCLLTRPSNRAQAGSMMSADYQYSATLTPTRSSNHPLICKIRSRSTPVCSHMRPQCVALEYGLAKPITLRHLNTCHNADAPVWPTLRPRDQTSKPNQIYSRLCAAPTAQRTRFSRHCFSCRRDRGGLKIPDTPTDLACENLDR